MDHRILRALQEDGRMTVQAIAERVGLSASPVPPPDPADGGERGDHRL